MLVCVEGGPLEMLVLYCFVKAVLVYVRLLCFGCGFWGVGCDQVLSFECGLCVGDLRFCCLIYLKVVLLCFAWV